VVLPARMRFSIRPQYVPARSIEECACCSLRTSPIWRTRSTTPTPGGDRGRHRRRRRHGVGAAERQRLRHRRH
jgi:hypothetical protein